MSNSRSASRLNWKALVTNAVATAKLLNWSRALLTLARSERDAANTFPNLRNAPALARSPRRSRPTLPR